MEATPSSSSPQCEISTGQIAAHVRRLITGKLAVVSACGAAPAPRSGAGGGPRVPRPARVPESSGALSPERHSEGAAGRSSQSGSASWTRYLAVLEQSERSRVDLVEKLREVDRFGLDGRYRHDLLDDFPDTVRAPLLAQYAATAGTEPTPLSGQDLELAQAAGFSPNSWNLANHQLGRAVQALRSSKAHIGLSDAAICELAEESARTVARTVAPLSLGEQYKRACTIARRKGVTPPEPQAGKRTLAACLLRLKSATWWRRALRHAYVRATEEQLRSQGFVHSRAALYVSEDTLLIRGQQLVRNRRYLESFVAVNDSGESVSLSDISDRNISNPRIRRAELMVRLRGFEEIARNIQYEACLYTVTVPSRFHPVLSRTGKPNPNFAQLSPRDAQRWITIRWNRVRSYLHRHDIHIFGFRVAEPHHDGTPHWHILLFARPQNHARLLFALERYFLISDNPDEPGARQHRVTSVRIDLTNGSAVGYLAKYIAKNIDGHAVGRDGEDGHLRRDARDTAERVDAWRSVHGIRQFQQIGGPPVCVYRELRRLDTATIAELEPIRESADEGNWHQFVSRMGGIETKARTWPVTLHREFNSNPGLYDDPIGLQVVGVTMRGLVEHTRQVQWEISPIALARQSCCLH